MDLLDLSPEQRTAPLELPLKDRSTKQAAQTRPPSSALPFFCPSPRLLL
jgi:hypothetical protein